MATQTDAQPNESKTVAFDAARNAEIAEVVKATRAQRDRLGSATGVTQPATLVTPLLALPEHEAEAYDAKAHLEKVAKTKLEAVKNEIHGEDAAYLYFYKCLQCAQHGLFFVAHPARLGSVQQNQWYASYKPKDQMFYMSQGRPLCQSCLINGRGEIQLPVESMGADGSFVPEHRLCFQRAKEPKRLAIEGEFRSFDLQHEASNTGRATVRERCKAAGLEVLI